jgi:hypothetical protein
VRTSSRSRRRHHGQGKAVDTRLEAKLAEPDDIKARIA